MMSKRHLKGAGLVLLAAATMAGVVTGREKPALEAVHETVTRKLQAPVDIDLAKLERADIPLPDTDPFARRSFAPKRAAIAPEAPPAPSAPPLPFQYIGKVIEDGKLEVYVSHGDELVSIARGKKIGAEYRVDKVTASSITFTYLPLKMQQTLDLPAVN